MQDSEASVRTLLVRSRGRDRCFDVSLETYSIVQKITYSEGLQSIAANFIAAYKSSIIMLQGEDLGYFLGPVMGEFLLDGNIVAPQ